MKNYIVPLPKYPASLPLEIAYLESAVNGTPLYTLEEIATHFGITVEEINNLREHPNFRAEVRACLLEIKDTNSLIRRKARAQYEHFQDKLIPAWLSDPEFPAAEKTKLIIHLAKTAKVIDDPLEKVKAEQEAAAKNPQQSAQPTLTLILQTTQGQTVSPVGMTIEQTPERISVEK